jgi:hypothetical protein
MKAQIPTGYTKAVIEGVYEGSTWANVLYFDTTGNGGAPPADVIGLVDAACEDLEDIFETRCVTTWNTVRRRIFYRDAPSSIVRAVTVASSVGTVGTDGESPQVAYLINWSTSDPRRGGKARTYVTGVAESSLGSSSGFGPTFLANWATDLNTWIVANASRSFGAATGCLLVEMSFVDAKADRATPVAFPISSAFVSNVSGTQRRRIDRLRI